MFLWRLTKRGMNILNDTVPQAGAGVELIRKEAMPDSCY